MSEPVSLIDARIQRRHLEYFLAVAEHGSFKAAAERLFVSASGVSECVRQLEGCLGVTLFERSRTGAKLTTEGHAIVSPANNTLMSFGTVVDAASEVSQLAGGSLDIVCIPTLAQEPAPSLIGEFHRQYPDVRIHLNEPAGPFVSYVVDSVLSGTNEVGLTELPKRKVPGLRITRMQDLDMWAVCPPGTPGVRNGQVRLEQLLDIGLVVAPYWESSDLYRQLSAANPDIDDAVVVRTEHRDTFISLALAGAGAVLVDRERALRAVARGGVVGRLAPRMTRQIAVVYRDSYLSRAAREFLRICAGSAARQQ